MENFPEDILFLLLNFMDIGDIFSLVRITRPVFRFYTQNQKIIQREVCRRLMGYIPQNPSTLFDKCRIGKIIPVVVGGHYWGNLRIYPYYTVKTIPDKLGDIVRNKMIAFVKRKPASTIIHQLYNYITSEKEQILLDLIETNLLQEESYYPPLPYYDRLTHINLLIQEVFN